MELDTVVLSVSLLILIPGNVMMIVSYVISLCISYLKSVHIHDQMKPSTLVLVHVLKYNKYTYMSTLVLVLKYNKYTYEYIGTCT